MITKSKQRSRSTDVMNDDLLNVPAANFMEESDKNMNKMEKIGIDENEINENCNLQELLPEGYSESDIKLRSGGFIIFEDNFHIHHIPLLTPIRNDINKNINEISKQNTKKNEKVQNVNDGCNEINYHNGNYDRIKKNHIIDKLLVLKRKLPNFLTHIKTESNSINNVWPLVLHTDDNADLNLKFRHSGKPLTVVNEESAIGFNQLNEIKELSYRLKKNLFAYDNNDNIGYNNFDQEVLKFNLRYGKYLNYIGSGSFGTITVYVKTVNNSEDFNKNFPASRNKWDRKKFDCHMEDKEDITFNSQDRKYFAVKEFRRRYNQDNIDRYCARIISEFIVGHSLCGKSLHLLNVLNLIETKDQKILQIMECCPSIDLYYYIRQCGKLDQIKTLEADCFMKQILQGISTMHYHGIAHCDIKLENILFYPNGLLKIADFGSSSVFQTSWENEIHYQQHLIGSKPYLAPEQFVEKFNYDPRLTDCWGCGILYMIMVHGRFMWARAKLYDNNSYNSFHHSMRKYGTWDKLDKLCHINANLTKLRKTALYKVFQIDPNDRYSVKELLESDWMTQTLCCHDDDSRRKHTT